MSFYFSPLDNVTTEYIFKIEPKTDKDEINLYADFIDQKNIKYKNFSRKFKK